MTTTIALTVLFNVKHPDDIDSETVLQFMADEADCRVNYTDECGEGITVEQGSQDVVKAEIFDMS